MKLRLYSEQKFVALILFLSLLLYHNIANHIILTTIITREHESGVLNLHIHQLQTLLGLMLLLFVHVKFISPIVTVISLQRNQL